MSSTVFTGPVLAGNVLNSDGTGNLAGVGGSSGTQNVGFVQMAQSATIKQNLTTTATATSIVVPAQSQITDIYVNATAAWSGTTPTLSVGISSAANELASGLTISQGQLTVPVTTLMAAWNNSSATQDVQIWVQSNVTGTGSAVLTVCYLQGINGFTNGQYT